MLHAISGIILGIIGFMFVYVLNSKYKEVTLSPCFVIIFAICFAISIGVVWEFFEFGMDRLFGFNMQRYRLEGQDGLVDTMTDLFVDFVGAILTAVVGYVYIKKENDVILREFFRNWFKKKQK